MEWIPNYEVQHLRGEMVCIECYLAHTHALASGLLSLWTATILSNSYAALAGSATCFLSRKPSSTKNTNRYSLQVRFFIVLPPATLIWLPKSSAYELSLISEKKIQILNQQQHKAEYLTVPKRIKPLYSLKIFVIGSNGRVFTFECIIPIGKFFFHDG